MQARWVTLVMLNKCDLPAKSVMNEQIQNDTVL